MIKQIEAIKNRKPLIENKGCSEKKRFKSENNPKKQLLFRGKDIHIHNCKSLLQKINLKKRLFSPNKEALRQDMGKKW
jgi:hypothetical protein